jgi:hypothetical protein
MKYNKVGVCKEKCEKISKASMTLRRDIRSKGKNRGRKVQ